MKKIQRLSILQVPFDVIDLKTTVTLLRAASEGNEKWFCVTPNPEICLLAEKNSKYLHLLQSAKLSIPDGFGILWAARFLQVKPSYLRWIWTLITPRRTRKESPFPGRVTGTDVMKEFCRRYPDQKIFLLGASQKVNDSLARKLKSQGVHVVGNLSSDDTKAEESTICQAINASQAKVLFVAFGAPKQEQWIGRNINRLPSLRVAIGVGGAFDFLSGSKRRAPAAFQRFGLEWLYRLVLEPRRIKRIFRATIVFPWRILKKSRES